MTPKLEHLEEFKQALADYQISEQGKQLLSEIQLVLMVSPTAAGRNTIIRELVKTEKYDFIVSHTTRPKRENDGVMEQDGVEYFFRSEEEMLDDLKNGRFLEAELIHNQQVSGISLRELEKAKNEGKIAIDEVEHGGIDVVHAAKPDLYPILVLPPDSEEWMRRFTGRTDMTTEEIQNRLTTAETILESVAERDYYKIVINDKLEDAVQAVRDIVEKNQYSAETHEQGKDLAWKLLGFVKQQLNS